MFDAHDMSTPVTRGELRAELAEFETRLEQKLVHLATKAELVHLATKADLENLATKAELENLATKADLENLTGALLFRMNATDQRLLAMDQRMIGMEQRLLAELERHSRANAESMSAQVSVIDEKYAGLPDRVKRLETDVSALQQRRRRKPAQRR